MKRVHLGFKTGLPTLMLIIATLLLAGCMKADSAIKTGPAGNGVDDLFRPLEGKASLDAEGDIGLYATQIQTAIQRNLYDVNLYSGKRCDLIVTLAPDGMLLDVRSAGGDLAFCRAAMQATINTRFPKPPSQAVYNVFKKTVLTFAPE
ncbi:MULTISPECIES: cell envelope integrity protein TolA [unclassified Serratia]|uniref:cell envelope integrity protein TolA n=1 Tax=unclassified Serratia (in: enterobacteria) TaxID=2647522 RepID=UPI0004FFAE69|nr:colicin transporter [Serratia sp. Ag2]KFK94151.1 colicin transporter [Serratia sp. Ag1]